MTKNETPQMRFEEVSRRAFLKRSATLGAAIMVPGWLLAACSGDEGAFSSTSPASQAAATTVGVAESSTTTATSEVVDSTTIPAGTEMLISFTYSANSDGGQVHNPYVAVWVEDHQGELAAAVALWFLQGQKGTKWLSDLRRWYSVDGTQATIDTISSATRTPGDYTVVWDGTGIDGSLVAPGEYYVCIEAAREHGPYSLIREKLTIGSESFDLALSEEGELTDASVSYAV